MAHDSAWTKAAGLPELDLERHAGPLVEVAQRALQPCRRAWRRATSTDPR
jgi:hypothetical protein